MGPSPPTHITFFFPCFVFSETRISVSRRMFYLFTLCISLHEHREESTYVCFVCCHIPSAKSLGGSRRALVELRRGWPESQQNQDRIGVTTWGLRDQRFWRDTITYTFSWRVWHNSYFPKIPNVKTSLCNGTDYRMNHLMKG